MSYRAPRFPWPFIKDDEARTIYYYIVSGWPTVMMGPKRIEECFPGYEGHLCSKEKFEELSQ